MNLFKRIWIICQNSQVDSKPHIQPQCKQEIRKQQIGIIDEKKTHSSRVTQRLRQHSGGTVVQR